MKLDPKMLETFRHLYGLPADFLDAFSSAETMADVNAIMARFNCPVRLPTEPPAAYDAHSRLESLNKKLGRSGGGCGKCGKR